MHGNGCGLLEENFCQNVIENCGQVMKNLSEYIRFKSGTYELVYLCVWLTLQFFISDCMKIKQDGYRHFVSLAGPFDRLVRRQVYLEG